MRTLRCFTTGHNAYSMVGTIRQLLAQCLWEHYIMNEEESWRGNSLLSHYKLLFHLKSHVLWERYEKPVVKLNAPRDCWLHRVYMVSFSTPTTNIDKCAHNMNVIYLPKWNFVALASLLSFSCVWRVWYLPTAHSQPITDPLAVHCP